MARGRIAIDNFGAYRAAMKLGDKTKMAQLDSLFKSADYKREYFAYFGYGYLTKPTDIVPPVALTFWSFRIMVGFGMWFLFLFVVMYVRVQRNIVARGKWWLRGALWSIPLAYIASQAGWVVAEVGRQPWTIQDLLPTSAAVSRIEVGAVQTTFWLFAVLFTILLIAEITIMVKQIKKGVE